MSVRLTCLCTDLVVWGLICYICEFFSYSHAYESCVTRIGGKDLLFCVLLIHPFILGFVYCGDHANESLSLTPSYMFPIRFLVAVPML